MAKKLSLAALKRHANTGTMYLELTEWHGRTGEEIRECQRGIRKVLRANSVALILQLNDGRESECRIDHGANLVDYDGEFLTIYAIGMRDLNQEEKNLFEELKKKQEEYIAKYPGSDTCWMKKSFFYDRKHPYLDGSEMICGKKYLSWKNKVLDCKVRGEAILKYKVYFDAQKLTA